ncbi:COP9 signalosome complex subunit 6 [Geranomyces variabilis]|nr:COP9 signalosome complex subunit 6 [Geranomyces variabilis]KAJ3143614.1 COP9 signalosome complex subunit 6 [Geranomyces variabilis]
MATPMDTDDDTMSAAAPAALPVKIVSDAPAASGLLITLHPLVITNISDQWTRTKMQMSTANPLVLGALLGIQVGRKIEVFDSFELPFESGEDGRCLVNKAYFVDKSEKIKQVFPKYDFLGWYATGDHPTARELHLHQQMIEHNESPLFLQLDPISPPSAKDFLIAIYESVIDIVQGQPQLLFLKAEYKIETGEAERIAVDHVALATNASAGKGSALITHLTSQRNAIKMLHSRTRILREYVAAVEKGEIARDHNIMRQISSLCNRLPTIDNVEFREEFQTDHNDVLLMSYLATITKGATLVNELVDNFNIVGPKRSGPNFPRGGTTLF